MDSLDVYKSERIEDIANHCTVPACDEPDTHTTRGHCCMYCGMQKNQHLKRCPKVGEEYITDPTSVGFDPRGVGEAQELSSGTFTFFYGGMGCQWYIRNTNGNNEYFFLHSDEMGQYGPDTSSIPCLVAFTHKYKRVDFRTT
jgi:hypothetical protein